MNHAEKTISLKFHAKMFNMHEKEYDIMRRKVHDIENVFRNDAD